MLGSLVRKISGFFGSGHFALLGLTTLALYEVALVVMLLLPRGEDGVTAFAEQFRLWCFGMDPATGSMPWGYVVTMLISPLMIGAMLALLWVQPLAHLLRRRPRAWLVSSVVSLAIASGALGLLAVVPGRNESGELPFPAESLRVAIPVHDFELTDHEGRPFRLSEHKGRVVLLTAVYASCGSTCPRIMTGAKEAVAALTPAEREGLTVVGVTLDPEHDTPEVLKAMVLGRQLDSSRFRFVTGEPGMVEKILDRYEFQRRRDPATGVIEHSNLFLLIDKDQRIAYRLALGDRQLRWLEQGLRTLLVETRP